MTDQKENEGRLSMTAAEIATIVVASLSLVVSLVTAYLTLLARFKGVVLPRRGAYLTQVNGECALILECEFINHGAKPGVIDDLQVKTNSLETGSQEIFKPYGIREHFSIDETYQASDFPLFSGVLLGARQCKEMYVVFTPTDPVFEPPTGIIKLRTYSGNRQNSRRLIKSKLSKSPVEMSLKLGENNSSIWKSSLGKTQYIYAEEIVHRRRKFIQDS
jgi:hypothetical protein